jgi:WD40 repeat protein
VVTTSRGEVNARISNLITGAVLVALLAVSALIVSACGDGKSGNAPVKASAANARRAIIYVRITNADSSRRPRDTIWTIWIAAADGSQPRPLTTGSGPAISPDGKRVAFSRATDSGDSGSVVTQLYAIGTDEDAKPRLLASDADRYAWSPDSRHLAIASADGLAVIDVETRTEVTIDRRSHLPFLGFSFSPSGRELVWVKARRSMGTLYTGDLFKASIDGGAVTRLTTNGRSTQPVWGPSSIAFAAFPPGARGTPFDRPFQLWTIRPDGSSLHRLSPKKYLVPVSWSQDGKRLLACFEHEFDCPPAAVDPATGSVRALRQASVSAGRGVVLTSALSRDGRLVLLTEGVFDGLQAVTQVPYSGGRARVLARNADSPDWNR